MSLSDGHEYKGQKVFLHDYYYDMLSFPPSFIYALVLLAKVNLILFVHLSVFSFARFCCWTCCGTSTFANCLGCFCRRRTSRKSMAVVQCNFIEKGEGKNVIVLWNLLYMYIGF